MKKRVWFALFSLLVAVPCAYSSGPLGLPGVGAVSAASGVERGELHLGLDNRVIPEARTYPDTAGSDPISALISAHTLFAAYGWGGGWTTSIGIPLYMDLPREEEGRLWGVGDLQMVGMFSRSRPLSRRFFAAELGVTFGTANAGEGMVPRELEFLREDQIASPLGRRRLAASLSGIVTQAWGNHQIPWQLHLRAGVHFPSKHYPPLLKIGTAVEKNLPMGWSVGSDLLFAQYWGDLSGTSEDAVRSLRLGLMVVFETDRNFAAQGGVSWNLLRDGEMTIREQERSYRLRPQQGVELRAIFSWKISLLRKLPQPSEWVKLKKSDSTSAKIEVEEALPSEHPFEEFDDWGASDRCPTDVQRYGAADECAPPSGSVGEVRSGSLPQISFKAGAETWGLEGFAVLDSLTQLIFAQPSVRVEFVVPIGKEMKLPSSVRVRYPLEELARRRANSLASYLVARGIKKERVKWSVVPGEGLVKLRLY